VKDKKEIMEIMERDVVFLRKSGLMDYSLLLAIESTAGSSLMNLIQKTGKSADESIIDAEIEAS
jgi:hypothetical protein